MPQENAFGNLLFLLEKRGKRGAGHKQNKLERGSGWREGARQVTPGRRVLWVKPVRSDLLTGGWGG